MHFKSIKTKINWLWDRFWSAGLSNPITAIEQISYLLFMRRLEYVEDGSFFIGYEDLKWSKFKSLPADELLNHIKNNVFPFLKRLQDPNEPFSLAMDTAVFAIEKPTLLKEAVEVIDDIYSSIEAEQLEGQYFHDTQGDLYEYLLKATNEAGKNGQFRTPRHIIQMMCEILDPNVGHKICDLTSGTAGFLVGAYQYILTKHSSKKYIQQDENGLRKSVYGDLLSKGERDVLKSNTFFGFDIDPTMVRIGLMNLMMHGITEPKIMRMDTLSESYDIYENAQQNNAESYVFPLSVKQILHEDKSDEQYDIILANPPFTGRIDKNTLSTKLTRIDSSQSELLFLQRIIRMLKPNGRAAVIIPEGVLFGSSNAQKLTRQILLKDCKLEAIISMPNGVFQPYTGVKTSILVFTKVRLHSEEYNTERIWFYGMDSDGYTLDTNRKKLKENPLPLVVEEYRKKDLSSQDNRENKHFYVPVQEVIDNGLDLSYNQYRDHVYTLQEHEPPSELLSRIIEFEKELLNDLLKLSALLK